MLLLNFFSRPLFLSAIGIAYIVFACGKYSHDYIQGTVFYGDIDRTAANATVVLQYWNPAKSSNPYHYDSVYTDADGHFSFTRKRKPGWQYRLDVHAGNYLRWNNAGLDIDHLKPPYTLTLNASWLTIRLKKNTNQPSHISVAVGSTSIYETDAGPFEMQVDKTILLPYNNEQFLVSWTISNANATQKDTAAYVQLNKNDTLTYLIAYD